METIRAIGGRRFPEQYSVNESANGGVGRKVVVHFNNDDKQTAIGVIIRDDKEPPLMTVIRLSDGRVVLATECLYSALSNIDVRLFKQFAFDISESWIKEHS